jgi:hypothetical protein
MRELRVSERDLVFALENRVAGVSHYLDTESGEVVPVFTYNREQILAAARASPGRYLRLAPQSGTHAFKAMEDFARSVSRSELRARLEAALKEEAKFKSFRHAVETDPAELDRWHRFRRAALVQAVRERLSETGVQLLLVPDRHQPVRRG